MSLLGFVVAVNVDRYADVDGDDGADDAAEGDCRELVDKLDAKEDDEAHKDENHRPVHLGNKVGVGHQKKGD
jgi:hypothetical protein